MSADTEIKGSICVLTLVNWEGRGEMYRVRYLGVVGVEESGIVEDESYCKSNSS